MAVLTRTARPADAVRIAYLSYLAGKGHVATSAYDLMFAGPPGPTPERIAAMAGVLTVQSVSWFHHSRYTVAEADGLAAACLCTFPRKESRNRPLFEAFKETGWTDDDLVAMRVRMQPFIRAELDVPNDAWVIENVGCYEQYRRRGLTAALLESATAKASEQGYRIIKIGVFIGNVPAISAYEKAGFAITGEKRDPSFTSVFDCPGMYQMTLEL